MPSVLSQSAKSVASRPRLRRSNLGLTNFSSKATDRFSDKFLARYTAGLNRPSNCPLAVLRCTEVSPPTVELGHQRHFERAPGTSGLPPIATELVRRGERRKGPLTEVVASLGTALWVIWRLRAHERVIHPSPLFDDYFTDTGAIVFRGYQPKLSELFERQQSARTVLV